MKLALGLVLSFVVHFMLGKNVLVIDLLVVISHFFYHSSNLSSNSLATPVLRILSYEIFALLFRDACFTNSSPYVPMLALNQVSPVILLLRP